MKKRYLILGLFFFCVILNAQSKDEREERVKLKDFPVKAQDVIRQLPNGYKRMRLYKETDGEKVSYEAKFKFKKQLVSLEFNTLGAIEDIEIEMTKKALKKQRELFKKIENFLKSKGKKYKLIRIQEQYIFPGIDALPFLLSVLNKTYAEAINYELIVQVKTDKDWIFLETLFNESGELLISRYIKPSSYGHILY